MPDSSRESRSTFNDSIQEVGGTWEQLAQLDPLWAVLSEPDKSGGQWHLNEFLQTGEVEIDALVKDLVAAGLTTFGSALDFGCGVGRLSIPLSSRFKAVTAVDIAPTMIAKATALAGERANIRFIVNQQPDLSMLDSDTFDLVYSNIVLQHMPPDLAMAYIGEFYRVVRRGGFVVFQIPSHLTDEWLPNSNDGTRLNEGLHHAEISVVDAPASARAGERLDIIVAVRNVSRGAWEQDFTHQLNLGNHWLDGEQHSVAFDDGRARLPGRLAPGESTELSLRATAPAVAGSYVLEFDVVQEGVNWFADRGSSTTRHAIQIEPMSDRGDALADAPVAPDEHDYPTFMMRGIPREIMEVSIRDHGAEIMQTLVHVDKWVSYRYLTRRINGA